MIHLILQAILLAILIVFAIYGIGAIWMMWKFAKLQWKFGGKIPLNKIFWSVVFWPITRAYFSGTTIFE